MKGRSWKCRRPSPATTEPRGTRVALAVSLRDYQCHYHCRHWHCRCCHCRCRHCCCCCCYRTASSYYCHCSCSCSCYSYSATATAAATAAATATATATAIATATAVAVVVAAFVVVARRLHLESNLTTIPPNKIITTNTSITMPITTYKQTCKRYTISNLTTLPPLRRAWASDPERPLWQRGACQVCIRHRLGRVEKAMGDKKVPGLRNNNKLIAFITL